MNAVSQSDKAPAAAPASQLRTLVLCDLADSTALVERLGDREGAELIRKHDRLARALLHLHGGWEIDKTDGFLFMFDRPIQAVAFALDYQRGLKDLSAAEKLGLAARVGIHVGDVVMWDNAAHDVARGAKPVEVEGLVKPIASRLMTLALPGQILLSGVAFSLAHRAQGELGGKLDTVRWRTHGRYKFKGVPDPIPVFEVGEEGVAPLKAPPWSTKAHREVPFWRRPAMVTAELTALALAIAIPLYVSLRSPPAIAFANRDWVVVGDMRNLTGERVFDDSLETAFRMGLEQSHYVNVLSDLKARDTLKLMGRDPQTTAVDRKLGAEIAIRDGARALILPTVAEIGGRVRVTAEVIDPYTQTTVWSESADGEGKPSVLPSVDRVTRELRTRLGEALATVSENSRPLEQVATRNLDALRMYSLALKQMAQARFPDALNFLNEALKLDPDFATVHLQIGRLMANSGHNDQALKELRLALAKPDRLAPRDQLLAQAHLASILSPRASLAKWKVLSDTYPDFSTGTGAYAYLAWYIANRYDKDVFAAANTSASPQNPNRAPALHLLGILDLGTGHYREALAKFEAAEAMGFAFKPYHTATLIAQGDYAAAKKLLPTLPAKFDTNRALGTINELLRIAIPLARGNRLAAGAALVRAWAIEGTDPAFADALTDVELTALRLDAPDAARRASAALADARTAFKPDDPVQAGAGAGQILLRAWLAARAGMPDQAEAALNALEPRIALADYPVLTGLRTVVKAQIAIARGNATVASALLQPLLDGSELCIVRVVLLDAYTRAGDYAKALEQTQWLGAHRGRALAEYNLDKTLLPFNVVQANLAWLSAAELELKLGHADNARRAFATFRKNWREDGQSAAILERVKALQAGLAPPASP